MEKKILFAALAVTAILTGCQKESILEQREMMQIEFANQKVGLSSETKSGGLLESTTFPQTWDFKVSAYDYIGSSGRSDVVINADTVKYNSSSSSWAAKKGPYYWPIGNVDKSGTAINTKLKMVGFAPASTLPGSFAYTTAPTIAKTGVSGSLTVSNNPANQVDFLYSVPADFSKGNSVSLTFKHAMTNVVFMAKAAAEYGTGSNKKDIQIVSIKLNNVYSTGSFVTTTSAVWTPSSPTAFTINNTQHSSASFTDASAATYSSGLKLTTSYQQFGDKHIFIPQSVKAITGENARAAITADIVVIVNKVAYYYKGIELTSFADAINAWEEGKKVTYNVIVGLNEVVFAAPVVTDWDSKTVEKTI